VLSVIFFATLVPNFLMGLCSELSKHQGQQLLFFFFFLEPNLPRCATDIIAALSPKIHSHLP
jgi:hypothetical protein